MRSIGPTVFILGLIMAPAIAQSTKSSDITTKLGMTATMSMMNPTMTSMTTTKPRMNTTSSMNTTIMTMNATITLNTNSNSSTTPSAGQGTTAGVTALTMVPPTKSESPRPPSTTPSRNRNTKATTVASENATSEMSDSTGIIIIIVIVLAALVLGVACYISRKRARRYSVDFHSRPDDAQIPLSTVEPDAHVDSVSQNGMQTFTSAEPDTKEPQESAAKPEGQEEQKAEADKTVVDPSTDPAALAPSPDGSADKAKEDTVEPTPAAPVEQSLEEKTDDEGAVSNKTSVESLKEPNKNNSNNAAKTGAAPRDWQPSHVFSEVPLDSPV
ncbi:uncharacterized protein [Centroberyx affinis]|uniref:uncharacterized protein n=1 Tax=Centroberyx affinis TaxID=166261 RepID=UPI003A5B9FCE